MLHVDRDLYVKERKPKYVHTPERNDDGGFCNTTCSLAISFSAAMLCLVCAGIWKPQSDWPVAITLDQSRVRRQLAEDSLTENRTEPIFRNCVNRTDGKYRSELCTAEYRATTTENADIFPCFESQTNIYGIDGFSYWKIADIPWCSFQTGPLLWVKWVIEVFQPADSSKFSKLVKLLEVWLYPVYTGDTSDVCVVKDFDKSRALPNFWKSFCCTGWGLIDKKKMEYFS